MSVIVAGGFEPWSSVLLLLTDCLLTHSYHLRWSSLERIYMNFYRVHLSHVLSQGGPTSFSTTCITRTTKKMANYVLSFFLQNNLCLAERSKTICKRNGKNLNLYNIHNINIYYDPLALWSSSSPYHTELKKLISDILQFLSGWMISDIG